jgi:putative peptidoglycan lipid II flippase
MMASLFLSRVLGVARDATMSGLFGATMDTDAYRLAFQVPDLMFFLVAGGALSSAFIPVFGEYFHKGREDDAWKVFSVVVSLMSLAVGAFIVAAWIFALPLARWVAPGRPEEIFPLIAHMSRIVLPAQFAFFIGGLMFGTLYTRRQFAVPGLGPNLYNLGIIFGAVALSWFFVPGVIGMSWGALIGAFAGSFFIPLWAMSRMGSRYSFSLDVSHPGVRKVFRLMLPVALGLSLPGVYGFIMMWFASFYPAGVVTWMDYANRLMQAPLGIFGQSLALAVFPTLTQLFAEQRMDLYQKQLAATLRTVLFITLPVSGLMFVLAPEIITVLYQHGRFTHADTEGMSRLLQFFSLGIAAWCLHPVLMRGFFAVQHSLTPVVVGTATSAVFVGLVLALKATPLDYAALPLASSMAAWLLALALAAAVRGRIGGLDMSGLASTLCKGVFAAAVATASAYVAIQGARSVLDVESKLAALAIGGLVALGAAWLYYGFARVLGMPESEQVNRALARVRRSKGSPPAAPGSASGPER